MLIVRPGRIGGMRLQDMAPGKVMVKGIVSSCPRSHRWAKAHTFSILWSKAISTILYLSLYIIFQLLTTRGVPCWARNWVCDHRFVVGLARQSGWASWLCRYTSQPCERPITFYTFVSRTATCTTPNPRNGPHPSMRWRSLILLNRLIPKQRTILRD